MTGLTALTSDPAHLMMAHNENEGFGYYPQVIPEAEPAAGDGQSVVAMHIRRGLFGGVAIVLGLSALLLAGTVAVAAAATGVLPDPPTNVALTFSDPDRLCAGDVATLSWSPPAPTGSSPITGYRIEVWYDWQNPPLGAVYNVDAATTSIEVPLGAVGPDIYQVWAITDEGRSAAPGVAIAFVEGVPSPPRYLGATIADHTVSLNLGWPDFFGGLESAGGSYEDLTVTLTSRPGGKTVVYSSANTSRPTVTGLDNRVRYSFAARATNRCGTADGGFPVNFQTGIAPAFSQATPRLTAVAGNPYRSRFHATGKIRPTYSIWGPTWLTIDARTGALSGIPPAGTTKFGYIVFAANPVGIYVLPGGTGSIAYAGPFSVTVATS